MNRPPLVDRAFLGGELEFRPCAAAAFETATGVVEGAGFPEFASGADGFAGFDLLGCGDRQPLGGPFGEGGGGRGGLFEEGRRCGGGYGDFGVAEDAVELLAQDSRDMRAFEDFRLGGFVGLLVAIQRLAGHSGLGVVLQPQSGDAAGQGGVRGGALLPRGGEFMAAVLCIGNPLPTYGRLLARYEAHDDMLDG